MSRGALAVLASAGLLLHVLACALGCNGRIDPGAGAASGSSSGNAANPGAGRTAVGVGPFRITCSVYHRDLGAGVTEHQRTSLVFKTNAPAEQSITLPGTDIPVQARLAATSDSPDDVALTVAFPRSDLQQEYRLARDHIPVHELVGFHGFTGLTYVSTPGSSVDVQFICEASALDEERPKPFPPPPGSSDPSPPETSPPPSPTPVRIQCAASVEGAGGPRTESFMVEGSTKRVLPLGTRTLEIHLNDDRFEGRSLVLRIAGSVQQLFQFNPTEPLVNPTRGPGGLTGTTTLRTSRTDAHAGAADGGAEAGADGGADAGGDLGTVTFACAAEAQ